MTAKKKKKAMAIKKKKAATTKRKRKATEMSMKRRKTAKISSQPGNKYSSYDLDNAHSNIFYFSDSEQNYESFLKRIFIKEYSIKRLVFKKYGLDKLSED